MVEFGDGQDLNGEKSREKPRLDPSCSAIDDDDDDRNNKLETPQHKQPWKSEEFACISDMNVASELRRVWGDGNSIRIF